MGKIVRLNESDLVGLIKNVINETVSVGNLTKSNNNIMGLTSYVTRYLEREGLKDVKESTVQKYLNLLSEELNKKNPQTLSLIKNKQFEKIGDLYMSTLEKTFYTFFDDEIGFIKRNTIRLMFTKEELSGNIKPHQIGNLISAILSESIESFPIDEDSITIIRRYIHGKRINLSEKLINWSMSRIY